jgi:uncharacterized protein YjbI with pentapeptide repeats
LGELNWLATEREKEAQNQQPQVRADLRGLRASFINLSGADLKHVDLRGSQFHAVVMHGAELDSANLSYDPSR